MSASERMKWLWDEGGSRTEWEEACSLAWPALIEVVEAAETYVGHEQLKRPVATLSELVKLSMSLTALREHLEEQ